MNAIVKNLLDPSWWFTGVFFILVAIALPRIVRRCQKVFRSFRRGQLAKTRRKIKSARRDPLVITAAIGKANAHYTVFLLLMFGDTLALFLLSATQGGRIPLMLAVVVSMPTFIFEIAWIVSDTYAKELIKARSRLQRPYAARIFSAL